MPSESFFVPLPTDYIRTEKVIEMNCDIPSDPVMLLSFVNMKLRDFYPSLNALCDDLDIDENDLRAKLASIDYHYDSALNKFI